MTSHYTLDKLFINGWGWGLGHLFRETFISKTLGVGLTSVRIECKGQMLFPRKYFLEFPRKIKACDGQILKNISQKNKGIWLI